MNTQTHFRDSFTSIHTSPKLTHHHFSFFTFYYTYNSSTKQFIPIAISKPNSTQKAFYYPNTSPTFPSLSKLISFYTNPSNIPLK